MVRRPRSDPAMKARQPVTGLVGHVVDRVRGDSDERRRHVDAPSRRDESQFSTKATPTAGAAEQPTSLTVEPRVRALLVSWGPPTGTPVPFDYQVSWSEGEGAVIDTRATDALSFEIGGLKDGVEYRIRVRARYGPGGAASQSAWVHARARTLPPPENRPPAVGVRLPDLQIGVGQNSTVHLDGAFTDPDGDPLEYLVASGSVRIATVSPERPASRRFVVAGVSPAPP